MRRRCGTGAGCGAENYGVLLGFAIDGSLTSLWVGCIRQCRDAASPLNSIAHFVHLNLIGIFSQWFCCIRHILGNKSRRRFWIKPMPQLAPLAFWFVEARAPGE